MTTKSAGNLVLLNDVHSRIVLDLAYAGSNNFTGKPIYNSNACYLHIDALDCLLSAVELLRPLDLSVKIWDAFRPLSAQVVLFQQVPNPDYVSDPESGPCSHCRGVALDLTITDRYGRELDMGTEFDDFRPLAHHGNDLISEEAQRNRLLLAGVMSVAGFQPLETEWWHYELPDWRNYPIISHLQAPVQATSQQNTNA